MLKKNVIFAVLAMALSVSATWAQGGKKPAAPQRGPSAEETMEFIVQNANTSGNIYRSYDRSYNNNGEMDVRESVEKNAPQFSFANGNMTVREFTRTYTRFKEGAEAGFGKTIYNKKEDYVSEGRLADLSPDVEVRGQQVVVSCTSGACFKGTTTLKAGSKEFGSTNSADVITNKPTQRQFYEFNSEEAANKIARALKHLIEISGGKKSLF